MKRFKSVAALALSIALATGLLAGRSSTTEAKTEAGEKSTIKLGGLAPFTDNYAEYGNGFQIGFQKAVDEINTKGGVNGHKFEAEIKDTQRGTVVSSNITTSLAEDESAMVILGDFTSGACKTNAEVVDRYGIVQLSPTASVPDYTNMSKYCFSIMEHQGMEVPYFAKHILKKYLGAQKIAVIRVGNDQDLSHYDNLVEQAEEEGLDVTIEKYATGEEDFNSLITKVRSVGPDCLVVMGQGGAVATVFNQADATSWNIQYVPLGPGTSEQPISQLTTPDNLIVTSPFFLNEDNETLSNWAKPFEEEAESEPTIHPACTYDCVYLIANAMEGIRGGEITRGAVQRALTESGNENMTGALGFTPDSDIERQYMICGVKDARWVMLEGFEYGTEGL